MSDYDGRKHGFHSFYRNMVRGRPGGRRLCRMDHCLYAASVDGEASGYPYILQWTFAEKEKRRLFRHRKYLTDMSSRKRNKGMAVGDVLRSFVIVAGAYMFLKAILSLAKK